MKENPIELSAEEITTIINDFGRLRFSNEFDIVYESQVPTAAIILLEGRVDFIKRNKSRGESNCGTLMGIDQLFHDQPVRYGARISAGSELVVIPKSAIMEAVRNESSSLYPVLRKLLKSSD